MGYGLGSEIAPISIGPFSIAAGDTLVRYTLDGDANLDAAVDTLDFNILAANFAQPVSTFAKADFNYDNIVDTIDFNLLATDFSNSLSPAAGVLMRSEPAPALTQPLAAGSYADRPTLLRDESFDYTIQAS